MSTLKSNSLGTANERRWRVLGVLCIAVFAINVDTTIVNVALPNLVKQLGASTGGLQWVVDAYNLSFAALVLAAGSLSDRFGRKGVLMIGLTIFGLATTVGAFGDSTNELIVARVAMGVGAALIFPNTLSILSNVFSDRKELAKAIGVWGATTGMAVAFGPIIGGWLLEHFWWGSVFLAMAPPAALALLLVALFVPTSRNELAPKLDRVGLISSTAALGLLVYAIIEAPGHGWSSSTTLASFGAVVVLLAVFLIWERRVGEPMLDLDLFRNLRFSAASGAISVAYFSLFGFIFLITMYFQFLHGYSPFSTGVRLLPVAFGMGISSGVGPPLSVKLGNNVVIGAGLALMAAGFGWIATDAVTTSYLVLAAQMVVSSAGVGFATAPATEAIMGVIPKHKAGVGAAVNDANRLFGGTLGVAVVGSVFASLYLHSLNASRAASVVSSNVLAQSKESVGAALTIARGLKTSDARAARLLTTAAHHAFFSGFSVGCLVAAGAAVVGAAFVVVILPPHPTQLSDEEYLGESDDLDVRGVN
jgi:EmrB/QacA subfamily drug resistance transporter